MTNGMSGFFWFDVKCRRLARVGRSLRPSWPQGHDLKNFVYLLQRNRLGCFGVMIALFIAGLDTVLVWMRGPGFDDMHGLLGILLSSVAAKFTPAASLIRAGSDRQQLLFDLFLSSYLFISLLFAALLWWRSGLANGLFLRRWRGRAQGLMLLGHGLLALQLLLALFMDTGLLYLMAAELAVVLPLRQGWRWLLVQILLFALLVMYLASTLTIHDRDVKVRLLYLLGEIIVQGLIFAACWISMQERRGRLQLAAAHAQLQATQSMLADTVRTSERMRIARDLHDAIGHHLTALNLHLDLAVRQPEDQRHEALQVSSELARSLLAEVRSVVNSERREQGINLQQALAVLCAGIPAPRIQLEFAADLEISSPALAHALFYCVQEAISNCLRHAYASQVLITFGQVGPELHVNISDDGIGSQQLHEGNGMRGMRERLQQFGGHLQIHLHAQRGHHLQLVLPLERCSL